MVNLYPRVSRPAPLIYSHCNVKIVILHLKDEFLKISLYGKIKRMKIGTSFIITVIIIFLSLYISKKHPNKDKEKYKINLSSQLTIILFILILIIGITVRIYQFGKIPNGLFRDEVANGYDAYSILNYGIDQNGYKFPIMLVSFGTGDDAIYSYFSMPFIAIFGLNAVSIRLVNLLMGIFSLIILFLFTRKYYGDLFALIALFILATNPWHIMISRWGLNVNIFPAFFLLGTYLASFLFEKEWFFIPSAIIYGLALYTYETSYFVIPVFLLILSIYLIRNKIISKKILTGGLLIIFLFGIPLALYVIINLFQLDPIQTPWFSIPRTTGAARMTVVTSLFSNENTVNALIKHINGFINVFFFQDDGAIGNAISGFGTMYYFGLPLVLLGLGITIIDQIKSRNKEIDTLILFWFIASLLLVFVMDIEINRINIIFLPLIYFIAKAIIFIYKQSKFLFLIVLLTIIFWFMLFNYTYFIKYPSEIGPAFSESLDQAINYASANAKGNIYISKNIHLAYIYVLFNQKIDPNDFISTVKYESPDKPIRYTASFGRYITLEITQMPKDGGAYILDNREIELFNLNHYQLIRFKYYCVLIPKTT